MSAQVDVPAHEIFLKKSYQSFAQQNAQLPLHSCTDSPEPSMLAYTKMKARVNINVYSPTK